MTLEELIKKYRCHVGGTHPAYDDAFKEGLKKSFVNDDGSHFNPGGPLFDPDNVRSMESYLEDQFTDDGESIPLGWKGALHQELNTREEARADLQEADYQYKVAKRKAINTGHRPPQSPTRDQLECQAAYDIIQIEEAWLINRIEELKQEKEKSDQEERRQRLRKDGIRGNGKINYETGRGMIDHQLVSPLHGDGVICILDPVSQYNGMAILDYREFIIPAYRQAVAKLEEVREQRHKELRKEWIASGAEPRDEPQRSTNRLKASFPAWPKGVPNHLVESGLVPKEDLPQKKK